MSICPCGSGTDLEQCCGLYFEACNAPTCEALMRSRYAAYVLGNDAYLRQSWHPDTCPEQLGGTALIWINLEIVATEQGQESDQQGLVQFIASFYDGSRGKKLHESSRFVRLQPSHDSHAGRWVYLDGQCSISDIGRNDPCPCGSGIKFKKCCGKASPSESQA